MINILLVCLGNICRSPMAEALFRYLVKNENFTKKIEVDSAATSLWQIGFPPHEGTLEILKKYNISSNGLIGRRLKKEDFWKYDYIIGMDESNRKRCLNSIFFPSTEPSTVRCAFSNYT
ncbi:low molecular weight protein-tyrosine-phosphatase [Lederbergia panacisoli]|uniref:low molecular weight protein-tyrosine-phosphatase n=1 Tax=Lederbergia panacisoli TaxID=1255251 RepID=UPI0027D8F5E4|nr:low molecular weight protein-tyrosine-phosphatase [Lederbergia panacisoli]